MTILIAEEQRDAALTDNIQLRAENQRLVRMLEAMWDDRALSLHAYQWRAHATSRNTEIGGNTWLYPMIGIANEGGELLGKVKKIFRDDDGVLRDGVRLAIYAELGDILWYVAEAATQLEIDLADLAANNLRKLADRANRGVIGGNGDER